MVAYTCNPSTEVVEAGRSGVQSPSVKQQVQGCPGPHEALSQNERVQIFV